MPDPLLENEIRVDKEIVELLQEGKVAEWNIAINKFKKDNPGKTPVIEGKTFEDINCFEGENKTVDFSDMKFRKCTFMKNAMLPHFDNTTLEGCALKYNVIVDPKFDGLTLKDIPGGRQFVSVKNEYRLTPDDDKENPNPATKPYSVKGDTKAYQVLDKDVSISVLKKDDVKLMADMKECTPDDKTIRKVLGKLEDIYDDKQKMANKSEKKGRSGGDGIDHNSFISTVTSCVDRSCGRQY